MRLTFQFERGAGQPRRLQYWLVAASAFAVALRYCRMAQRDEENGFPCTAAFEWRRAAELCGRFDRVAGHCWQQWERLMGVPRRLAVPLGAAGEAPMVIPPSVASARRGRRCRLSNSATRAFSYLRRRCLSTLTE